MYLKIQDSRFKMRSQIDTAISVVNVPQGVPVDIYSRWRSQIVSRAASHSPDSHCGRRELDPLEAEGVLFIIGPERIQKL